LYRDIRTYGRGHEEYYDEASRQGVLFFRYEAEHLPIVSISDESSGESSGESDGFPLSVQVKDTLTFGEELEISADMVVLATGMVPRDIHTLIDELKLSRSADGFLQEVHPKLRPVELAVSGVFVAGTCQAPMDIGESCAAGSAAAVKATALLATGQLELSPFRARVDLDICSGEGKCIEACQYQKAVTIVETDRDGCKVRRAEVNAALCNGCGICAAVCPTGAIQVDGWRLEQFDAMVDALVADHSQTEAGHV
jgi:heterodisulfide reductase subunit A